MLPIGRERNPLDQPRVPAQRGPDATGGHVPEVKRTLILALEMIGRREGLAVGREGNRPDRRSCPGIEASCLSAARGIPEPYQPVVATGGESLPVGREDD